MFSVIDLQPSVVIRAVTLLSLAVAVVILLFRFFPRQDKTSEPSHQTHHGADAAAPVARSSAEVVLQNIKSRRSVYPKDFNGEVINKETIRQILEAGNWAPTHKVTEPWRFAVVSGEAKAQLYDLTIALCRSLLTPEKAEKTVEKLQMKRAKALPKISHFIAICMKRYPKPNTENPEWEEMCAVAAAAQNMALAAAALGVAGYWTSWQEAAREAPEMKEYLGIAPEDKCLGFLVLGHSDRIESYRGSRRPVEEKVIWKE